jgi:hypothetical protein
MDPDLGTVDRGVELTCLGAMDLDAEVVGFPVDVCECGV